MTQQYTPNLGEVPAADARRDAVHIAVAPVVAGMKLYPAQHVRLAPSDGKALEGIVGMDTIGIVDPFLLDPVQPGQRCWVFLYPGTVTSLRHVWSHPAFTAKLPEALP